MRANDGSIEILQEDQCVVVREKNGNTHGKPYDKLVLAPGANAVVPRSIQETDGKRVFFIRNMDDICRLKEYTDAAEVKNLVVVGGFENIEIKFCQGYAKGQPSGRDRSGDRPLRL